LEEPQLFETISGFLSSAAHAKGIK